MTGYGRKIGLKQYQRGAGFIEVLVALVILAVGLLGVLSMQARGIDSNQRAFFTTDVTILAYDMADRILAFGNDGKGAIDGSYLVAITRDTEKEGCAAGAECTILEYDTDDWIDAFNANNLPAGRGDVTWASPVYTITIRWDQDRVGNLPTNNSISADCDNDNDTINDSTDQTLTCFQLQVSLNVDP